MRWLEVQIRCHTVVSAYVPVPDETDGPLSAIGWDAVQHIGSWATCPG